MEAVLRSNDRTAVKQSNQEECPASSHIFGSGTKSAFKKIGRAQEDQKDVSSREECKVAKKLSFSADRDSSEIVTTPPPE